jgi:hypothetical protein
MPKWDVCIKNETHNLKERIGQHLHLNQVPMLLFFLKPHDSVFFYGGYSEDCQAETGNCM